MQRYIHILIVLLIGSVSCLNGYAESGKDNKTEDTYQMESITVTVRKKEANTREVPVSVDVFSDIRMEDAGIENTPDLLSLSPNIHMMNRSCEHIIVIRGISPFRASTYSPVGFYVDDVSYPMHYMQNFDFFDIERAEVLKGPQGTLYGRNAESGVVSIMTKRPGNEMKSKVSTQYGSYDTFRGTADLSGPIIKDKLFLGGAFNYKSSKGYIENNSNNDDEVLDSEHTGGRLSLRWTPTELWDLSLTTDIMKADDHAGEGRFLTGPHTVKKYEIQSDSDAFMEQDWNSQNLRIKYSSDKFEFLSVSGVLFQTLDRMNDVDLWDDPTNKRENPSKIKTRQYSQEFRISSQIGSFEWLAGLYGFMEESEFDYSYNVISSQMTYMSPKTDVDSEGYAVFGQGTYTFLDRFHLTAGVRLDHQEMEGALWDDVKNKGYSKEQDFDEVLPKFALACDLTQNMMTYVSAAKGYMTGAFNWSMTGSSETFTYDPEYTWNYEAGIKTAWLDEKFFFDLAFFYVDIRDKQVSEMHPTIAAMTITNAAEAHSRGLELQLKARPLTGLDLYAGFGWSEAVFDKFNATVWNAAGDGLVEKDYTDNHLTYAPEYTYNLGAQYRDPSGLFARLDFIGTGRFYGDAANETKQSAYEIVNLRVGYEWENFDFYLWADNVFDEHYFTFLSPFQRSIIGIDGSPRVVGATITWRY